MSALFGSNGPFQFEAARDGFRTDILDHDDVSRVAEDLGNLLPAAFETLRSVQVEGLRALTVQ